MKSPARPKTTALPSAVQRHNAKGQRPEPAATDVPFVREPTGWLRFAAPPGSAMGSFRHTRSLATLRQSRSSHLQKPPAEHADHAENFCVICGKVLAAAWRAHVPPNDRAEAPAAHGVGEPTVSGINRERSRRLPPAAGSVLWALSSFTHKSLHHGWHGCTRIKWQNTPSYPRKSVKSVVRKVLARFRSAHRTQPGIRAHGCTERKGQPPEPAADDVRFVSEPTGWLRLAAPPGSAGYPEIL